MEENQENSFKETYPELHQVTPFSKYLALALFVILPFIFAYIGYTFGFAHATHKSVQKEIYSVEMEDKEVPEVATSTESFVLSEGEKFFVEYHFDMSDSNCLADRKYLDCLTNILGLYASYRLPAEFDVRNEDALYLENCRYGREEGERVDRQYCEAEYYEIVPALVDEAGNVLGLRSEIRHECTLEFDELSLERLADTPPSLLSFSVSNPSCHRVEDADTI